MHSWRLGAGEMKWISGLQVESPHRSPPATPCMTHQNLASQMWGWQSPASLKFQIYLLLLLNRYHFSFSSFAVNDLHTPRTSPTMHRGQNLFWHCQK